MTPHLPTPHHLLSRSLLTPMSARQQQIAHYLTTTPLPLKQISHLMNTSESNIKSLARIVYAKHNVSGRTELIFKLMNVTPKLPTETEKENENDETSPDTSDYNVFDPGDTCSSFGHLD